MKDSRKEQGMDQGFDRLARQIEFILEVDRLKEVLRQTRILEGGRRENSAEHSWHIALMAMVLQEYANEPVDVMRVIKMLLIHDIVEIDAGDTFAYGDQSLKALEEEKAAVRIFGLLPAVQRSEFIALWDEFEARATAESRFANAMDRLMPALHNYVAGGGTWAEHHVTRSQVHSRLSPIGDGSTVLFDYVWPLIQDALGQGENLP